RPRETGSDVEPAPTRPVDGLAAAAFAAARRAGAFALSAGAAFAPLALGAATPGGALVRATMLRGLPVPRTRLDDLRSRVAGFGARFDGRLRIAAVDRRSGR